MDGFEVIEVAEAATLGDLFITVTGNTGVVRGEHFAAMKNGAIDCDAGHSNVELAFDQLKAIAATVNSGVREFVEEDVRDDGGLLFILGGGRLIHLAAAHGRPAGVMDMRFTV